MHEIAEKEKKLGYALTHRAHGAHVTGGTKDWLYVVFYDYVVCRGVSYKYP